MFRFLTKSKIQNLKSRQRHASEIQNWLPLLALLLIIGGQLYYLPERWAFGRELLTYSQAEDGLAKARLAYHPADYDLLAWVEQATPPETTLLLVTASPATYGDPSYVLYHRAITHLAPRSVWWAAPVAATRYPAWWTPTDLSETDLRAIARRHQATVLLADGFATPPLAGPHHAFDADTQLIFLEGASRPAAGGEDEALVIGPSSLVTGHWSLGLLRLVGAGLVIVMWGDLVFGAGSGRASPPALRLAAAWLLGSGVVSLALFGLLGAGLPLRASVIGLSVGGIGVWLIVRGKQAVDYVVRRAWCVGEIRTTHHALRSPFNRDQRTRLTPHHWSLLFLLLLFAQVGRVAWAAIVSPLTDWDGWVNWASKAHLLFSQQALTPTLYHNPARLPTNMDYPLLLPLLEAWGYTWLGRLSDPAVGLISLAFYLALLLLFYQAARRLASTPAAWGFTTLLASVPRLERPAHSGLADIPLAALLLLTFLLLQSAYNGPTRRLALLAGLAAGLLPWLKSEGWLWWGLILLVGLSGVALKVRRRELSHREAGRLVGLYLGPALLAALPWPLFLATHGTIRFTFLPLTAATLAAHLPRWPVILLELARRLLNPYWNFVWLLAGATLLVRRGRVFQPTAHVGWLIGPVAGYLFLISLTYIFSRFAPYLAHLNNSIERLLLHALPLALWWLVGQAVAAGWVEGNRTDT